MKTPPKIIDIDLINELKRKGKYNDVKVLLKVFHNDIRKSGRQAKNSYNTKIRRVENHLKICNTSGCINNTEGHTHCEICREKKKIYNKRRYTKRKKEIVCVVCQGKIAPGKLKCRRCIAAQKRANKKHSSKLRRR